MECINALSKSQNRAEEDKILFYQDQSQCLEDTGFDNNANMLIKFKHIINHNTQIFQWYVQAGDCIDRTPESQFFPYLGFFLNCVRLCLYIPKTILYV